MNTYLLEAGYLTRIKNTDPPTYQIVNGEIRNLFAARYKQQWCERIPLDSDYQPFRYFAAQDYKEFFAMANNILKTKYVGEDFQYPVFSTMCQIGTSSRINKQDTESTTS